MNGFLSFNSFINVESGNDSKIACQCYQDFGGFHVWAGCKWKLLESNCPSLLFSIASESVDLDNSFGSQIFTGDSFEEIETTSTPVVTTQAKRIKF